MPSIASLSQERMATFKARLWQSGAIGALEGSIVGILSGWYIMHGNNHGKNAKLFSLSAKAMYIVSWCAAGIVFSTNLEKAKIKKQMLKDQQVRKEAFLQEQLSVVKDN